MTASFAQLRRGGIGRAGISSLVATATDYGTFSLLLRCGGVAALATLVGCVVGGIVNFSVNRHWAFRAPAPLTSSALRYAMVSGVSALANALLVDVFTVLGGLAARPSWAIVRIAVFLGFTFPLFRAWVFVLRGHGEASSASELNDLSMHHLVAGVGPIMQSRCRPASNACGLTAPTLNA